MGIDEGFIGNGELAVPEGQRKEVNEISEIVCITRHAGGRVTLDRMLQNRLRGQRGRGEPGLGVALRGRGGVAVASDMANLEFHRPCIRLTVVFPRLRLEDVGLVIEKTIRDEAVNGMGCARAARRGTRPDPARAGRGPRRRGGSRVRWRR